jgi:hypothetical protein
VQEFVSRKSQEKKLGKRLHAIWFVPFGICNRAFSAIHKDFFFRYCVSMANDRPSLDLKHFDDVCPDRNSMSKHNFLNWRSNEGFF